MRTEVTCIVASRLIYLSFRAHRYVFNFGYGHVSHEEGMIKPTVSSILKRHLDAALLSQNAEDVAMTSLEQIFTSLFLELAFEGMVDALAVDIESR